MPKYYYVIIFLVFAFFSYFITEIILIITTIILIVLFLSITYVVVKITVYLKNKFTIQQNSNLEWDEYVQTKIASDKSKSYSQDYKKPSSAKTINSKPRIKVKQGSYNSKGWDKCSNHKDTGTKFNKQGYDIDGFSKKGWNRKGINKTTKTKFDKDGYDSKGRNKDSNNKGTGTKINKLVHNTNGGYEKDLFKKIYVDDIVVHKERPDLGSGVVLELLKDDKCIVDFNGSQFSSLPLDRIELEHQQYIKLEQEKLKTDVITLLNKYKFSKAKNLYDNKCASWWGINEFKKLKKEYKEKLKSEEKEILQNKRIIKEKQNRVNHSFSQYGIKNLWHITHRDNVNSILKLGLLNHYDAYKKYKKVVDISDQKAQRWREELESIYGRKIHEYTPLYINQKNPMLYVKRDIQNELCLIQVSLSALVGSEYLITDGNAASRDTVFYNSINALKFLPWDVLRSIYWNDFPDGKRKKCAEVLIYPKITPNHIEGLHCCSLDTMNILSDCGCPTHLSKNLFF